MIVCSRLDRHTSPFFLGVRRSFLFSWDVGRKCCHVFCFVISIFFSELDLSTMRLVQSLMGTFGSMNVRVNELFQFLSKFS